MKKVYPKHFNDYEKKHADRGTEPSCFYRQERSRQSMSFNLKAFQEVILAKATPPRIGL